MKALKVLLPNLTREWKINGSLYFVVFVVSRDCQKLSTQVLTDMIVPGRAEIILPLSLVTPLLVLVHEAHAYSSGHGGCGAPSAKQITRCPQDRKSEERHRSKKKRKERAYLHV